MLGIHRRLSRSHRRWVWLTCCVLLLLVLCYLLLGDAEETPLVVDGPGGELQVRVIPRIIHQTYLGRRIPKQYWASVESWHRQHPDYVYYLWTDADIERFMAAEYPEFVPLFKSYRHKLQRVDAIRYFILFHYGGIYADMDVSAFKPLDPLLNRFSCIISRERFEQSMFLWYRPQCLMNAVMASAPRHPFMRFVMLNLSSMRPSWLRMFFSDVVHDSSYILASTGPLALTDLYKRYPPCRRGASAACDVYLSPPKEMLPRVKPATLTVIHNYCTAWYSIILRRFFKWRDRSCSILEANGFQNSLPADAFTDHAFSNLGYHDPAEDLIFRDISELVGKGWRRYSHEKGNKSSTH